MHAGQVKWFLGGQGALCKGAGVGVSVLRTWACQRDIHSPISSVVCRARGCPRGTAPAVVKAERSAVNGNGCPTPVGGWVPLHSGSCRGLYRPSVGRGLRVYRVGGVSLAVFPTNPLPHSWCWVINECREV